MRFRPAKEVGKNRFKEASVRLLQRLPGGAVRKGSDGGTRDYPAQWTPTRRRSVEGFTDATPDPPRSASRNSRRASLLDIDASEPVDVHDVQPESGRANAESVTSLQ